MKKYVLNIDRLYSGQTANALVLNQVDQDFPVLIPTFSGEVLDIPGFVKMWQQRYSDFNPPSIMTVFELNMYIVDFNLGLQTKFKDSGRKELYMIDDTQAMRPNRRTFAVDKTYMHCLNGKDEEGRNVSQMGVLFPYKKMSSKSLYTSYLQLWKPQQMDDLLEYARGITFQGKTTYRECLQSVTQVGNQMYVMTPNVDLDNGAIHGNNITVMNGHGIPLPFPPTMTLFQPCRSQYDNDNLFKDQIDDGITNFMKWYGKNNHKTRISLNETYGTNITTLESIGPSSYRMELPTYCPNYLIFMEGETLSDKDVWLGLNSTTFRNIRSGKQYPDTYEDGKYIIDNERLTSHFPNVGLLMNLYDTFITEHDRVLRIRVPKDPDYNRFVLKFDWQVVVDSGLVGNLDVVFKVGFTDDEKTLVFEKSFSKSTEAETYAIELPDSALHEHSVDIVVMMRHDVDFGRRNSEHDYRNRLRMSGFLLSNFRVFQDEVERKDNLTFGDYVNEEKIPSYDRTERYNEFWQVSQYKKDLTYQTVVETSLKNMTTSGIAYPNNYSSGDLYGDMFVTKSVLDPRYDMNMSVDGQDDNILVSEGRDYIGLGSCSNQLSLFYKPTEIHIGRNTDGSVFTSRDNPETPLNYQMVEVVKNINRFESSIKHKSNVFSVVVENSNLAPDDSSTRDETLEKYKKHLRDSVIQFVRNTCEGVVPVHTQLFDVQFT